MAEVGSILWRSFAPPFHKRWSTGCFNCEHYEVSGAVFMFSYKYAKYAAHLWLFDVELVAELQNLAGNDFCLSNYSERE